MSHNVVVIGTLEASGLMAGVRDGMVGHGLRVDLVPVGDPSDLPAAVMRAGRVTPEYTVAVVVGGVDRALEQLVTQSINAASTAVRMPTIVKLNGSPDAASLVARALTIAGIGGGGASVSRGFAAYDVGAPVTTAVATPPATTAPAVSTVAFHGRGLEGAPSPLRGAGRSLTTTTAGPGGGGGPRPGPPGSYASAFGSSGGVDDAGTSGGAHGAAGLHKLMDPAARRVLDMLREALIRHGGKGIAAIGRKFRIVDDDGNKQVSPSEFVKALREMRLTVFTPDDIATLFAYFDHDRSGSINYDELLVGLRGELNERRRALVQQAFKKLDRSGDGVVTVDDMMLAYDTAHHPDVVAGRLRKEEVLRSFLDGFDGGSRDGRVTPLEFERYYATLSASIDDDDYFELMMRNCWHLSGGVGWSENTTNRRVLVTLRDGSQKVMEVPDDVAMGSNVTLMKRALQAKGYDVVAVSLHGGADTTSLSLADGMGTWGGGGGTGGSSSPRVGATTLASAFASRSAGSGMAAAMGQSTGEDDGTAAWRSGRKRSGHLYRSHFALG